MEFEMPLLISSSPEGLPHIEAVAISSGDGEMVGTLYRPPVAASKRALLVLTALPQYRPGPHCQYVRLAHHASEQGTTTLLFDLPGTGDSVNSSEAPIESIRAAVDFITKRLPHVSEIVLAGLCDGANLAVAYANTDKRITHLALSNPWLESEADAASVKIRGYYRTHFFGREFWRSLANGQVNLLRSALAFARTTLAATKRLFSSDEGQPERIAAVLNSFPGRILMILSGQDPTGQLGQEMFGSRRSWQRLKSRDNLTLVIMPNADHTFSSKTDEEALLHRMTAFLDF